jgi:hypothetical protein
MYHRTLAVAILVMCGWSAYAAGQAKVAKRPSEFSAKLKVEVDGPLLANFPIQLKLTVINTGKTPFSIWCPKGLHYPNACMFSIAVTDGNGRTNNYVLDNEAPSVGSGYDVRVKTTMTLPAVFDPLPPGNFTLKVTGAAEGHNAEHREGEIVRSDEEIIETWPAMSSEPINITVKEDPIALAKAEKDLLAKATEGAFAEHVVRVLRSNRSAHAGSDRSTQGVAFRLLLAGESAVLLAILLLIFVRRRKRSKVA